MSKVIEFKDLELIVEQLLQSISLELVDMTYKQEGEGLFLKVYIDSPEGVNIKTCTKASKLIKNHIDECENIPYDFIEISSPGIDRILKKPADFELYIGNNINVKTLEAIEGSKKFSGHLISFENQVLEIEVDEKKVYIPFDLIQVARLNPDL